MRIAKRDWRPFLNSAEKAELERLEKEASKIDGRRRELTAALNIIRNRCMQRALEHERRRGKQEVLL